MNFSLEVGHRRHLSRVFVAVAALSSGCGGDATPPQVEGSVTVSVTTSGENQDADGYTVRVGSTEATVSSSGSVTIEGLESGTYEVALAGVAANCSPVGEATRSVTVEEGQEASASFGIECAFDAAGVALPEASCSSLTLSAMEGMPFDVVTLGDVPSTFVEPIFARMSWPGGAGISLGLVDEESDGLPMTIPLHPSGSMEGGEVTVRISDETQTCPPFNFSVLPLPSATGELEGLADAAQALLDAQASLFGTTRDALADTPLSELEPALVPVAIAQTLVDASSSETSLRAFADGTAADFDAADLDFVERLLARTGMLEVLQTELQELQTEAGTSAAATGARPGAGAPARSPGLALDCLVEDEMEAALLADCMTLARGSAQGQASARTQDNAIFAMEVAAALGSRSTAKPIASLIKFKKLYDEAIADNLPSSFVSLDVTAVPNAFLEDQPGPGTWAPAMVTAESNGWDLSDVIAEIIVDRVTPSIRPVRNRLSRPERYLLLKSQYGEQLQDILDVENFFQGLLEILIGALGDRGAQLGDGILTVPPLTFGPVDITDTEWTDSRVVSGSSVVLSTHEQYEPQEPGTSFLEIITAVGKFGGTSIETADIPIEVTQIEVRIEPVDVVMQAGGDTTFTVTVSRALHPDSVELVSGHPAQGSASLELGPDTVHTVTYTAPAEPTQGSTDLVAVHHVGGGGARGQSSEPRSATATIRFAGIRLLPVQGCVTPGQDVQLEWELTGFDTAPDLVWDPSAGSVDGNGVFTAPGQPGTVTISVAVEGFEGVEDSITVPVGECVCSFSLQVGSNATYVGQPGDEVSYFAATGSVPGEPYAVGYVSFANAAGFSAVAAVELPTIAVTGPGDYPLSTIAGGLGFGGDEDFFQEADPTRGTLRIVEYQPHTSLVGEVIGGVVQDAFDSESPEVSFSAAFQIYPPEGSLGWTYSCVIPDPEGG